MAFLTPAERREWDCLSRPRASTDYADYASDPLGLARLLWPGVRFYDRQEEIILSVRDDAETIVPAAHQVGKDFVSGFVALWFYLSRHPCRVVTTSVKDDHLRVLWGEIGRFIDTAAHPLTHKKGGPLIVNHRDVRKVGPDGRECRVSYLRGMVSETGEGMAGHHAAHTLLIVDEASGVDDLVYERADTWAKRKLVIGNPYDCRNFFYKAVKQGGLPGRRRRVIRIRAEDSPNVRRALARERGEPESSWPAEVPGVLSYAEYLDRRRRWDVVRQTVGLDAAFYEGAENLLFPPAWLARAERMAERLRGKPRKAEAIGIDPGEGTSETSMCAVDRLGIIELCARRTPDTSAIRREALAFMRKHNVPAGRVGIDAGGGGKQIADDLRADGHAVRLVSFGTPAAVSRTGPVSPGERREASEDRLTYVTLRDQMYGQLRLLLDPEGDPLASARETFAIPAEYAELRRQLAPIPLTYDREGRLNLLPKRKPGKGQCSSETLLGLIGCSPDQADSLAVAVHVMLHPPRKIWIGAYRT